MAARVAGTIATNPAHVYVMCGVNDKFNHGGAPILPAASAANALAYITALRAALPGVMIHWVESLWDSSEKRPDGSGASDAATQATMAAIRTVVQATAGCEWLGIRADIWGLYSLAYNPTNLTTGAMTQVDGTHPSASGQAAISNAVYSRTTLGV